MNYPTTTRDPNINWTDADYHAEMARHRQTLISEGRDPEDPTMLFAICALHLEQHKHDLTFRQRQDLGRWLGESWVAGVVSRTSEFTEEERTYLRERLAGVNDPLGQSVLAKLG